MLGMATIQEPFCLEGREIMTLRDELFKIIADMSEEELSAVMEYIRFLREPEEVEPTADELRDIARGREEYPRGEFVVWRSVKTDQSEPLAG
jgi:hypothetical protein